MVSNEDNESVHESHADEKCRETLSTILIGWLQVTALVPRLVMYPAFHPLVQKKLTGRLAKTGGKAGALKCLEKLQRISQILPRTFSQRSSVDNDKLGLTRRQSNTSHSFSSS
jgi:hypothetical protein